MWYSDDKLNLTFSTLITEPKYLQNINVLNFAASLALAVSIENLYQLRTELKWPNDILIDGKKAAGILIESTSKGSKVITTCDWDGFKCKSNFISKKVHD